MSKHTQGPWFVFGNGHCVGGPVSITGAGQGIAMCGMRARTAEEAEANARLIAAAPELFDALNAYVEADRGLGNDGLSLRQYDRKMEKAHKQAVSALRKALEG